MRRALGLAITLVFLTAAPAAAQDPTIRDFEDQAPATNVDDVYAGTDVSLSDGDSCAFVFAEGGNFGPRHLGNTCPPLVISFRAGQAQVSFYAKVAPDPMEPPDIDIRAFDANQQVVAQTRIAPPDNVWTPVVLRTAGGAPAITLVELESRRFDFGIDDLGYSTSFKPSTQITGGPSGTVSSRDATFTFAANQDDRLSFFCKLDDQPSESCGSPKSYSGLGDGQHTFSVITIDRWGTRHEVARTWTIQSVPDRDGDGVPDATDNCPDTPNAGQGNADGDEDGDACELIRNDPPDAGETIGIRVIRGPVFFRLPPGAALSAFTGALRVPFQDAGFLPLKGVGSLPVGTVVDARQGELAVTAAINGRPPESRRQLRREARFLAGIFQIRQRRASRRRPSRRVRPRALLTSAPGAQRPCTRRSASGGPPKGVTVRSLTTVAKGAFRTVGGASTATPVKGTATFNTTDRCDGTVTRVGRGRVAVVANRKGKRARKRRTVRAGRAYIVRARLFAARKGRRGN